MVNSKNGTGNRLIIVSNRLPVTIARDKSGGWQVSEGAGGLVTAMAPVLRDRGGLWIGWSGMAYGDRQTLKNLLDETTDDVGYRFEPVILTEEEVDRFYYGFSNEILWPLFHDLQTRCNFDPTYWDAYQTVNRKFAKCICDQISPGDHIWVHDYHLMLVGKELRQMGVYSKIGYFLHTPFPSPDLFFKLPWRFEILKDLLAYDLIGFQTLRDRRNFVHCLQMVYKNLTVRGRGKVLHVPVENREISIGYFPISIDFEEFANNAKTDEVRKRSEIIHQEMNVQHIVLGVDRLDYTKGIPEKLAAFELALELYPELQGNTSLLQLVVPSRLYIPKYMELREQVEIKISKINGRFGRPGWMPIHYMFRAIDHHELLAFYRAADIALITPLKDGMNLVCKEYCAANVDGNGVLILSEFAGAKAQLQRGALLVNPYDIKAVAKALRQATQMDLSQRRKRMLPLRKSIHRQDVYEWVDTFLEAVFVRRLKGFPLVVSHQDQPRLSYRQMEASYRNE
jgi:trehalose 6-phosphate synthase